MDLNTARHAFITGGASGIGLAIGEALGARGVRVTLADVDEERLRAVNEGRSNAIRTCLLDTRDRLGWAIARDEAEAAFGPVDILVNNAGIGPNRSQFADMAPDSWDRIVAINLTGVANGVFAFGNAMRDQGRGHIVNTASLAGLTAERPTLGAYAAAKFGVMALSETLRAEMAPHGVGVSVLCPGLVSTNLGVTTARLGYEDIGDAGPMPGGMSPAAVAAMVLDGIARNLPYIITHPDRWEDVGKRHARIKAAFDDAAASLQRPALD